MSVKELDRVQLMTRLSERRLTQRHAAELAGVTERQVRRWYRRFKRDGAAGLVSRQCGQASHRQFPAESRARALDLVRARYADFGPTLAHQTLTEEHGLALCVETLRQWMIAAEIWLPRAQRLRRSHPPRERRACRGELVQIDGCARAWFEDRGPICTLLVYVDDATGSLMELRFAESESTFAYFAGTRCYLETQGKPVAFYSDRLSVFRVARKEPAGGSGLSQFGRAMQEQRRVSTNLTLTHNRILYVLEDTVEHRRLRGHRVTVHEHEDGTITIRYAGRVLPHRAHPKDTARITQGAIVDHKRLGATLQWIAERQRDRDQQRVANRSLTLRQKQRIRMDAGLPA